VSSRARHAPRIIPSKSWRPDTANSNPTRKRCKGGLPLPTSRKEASAAHDRALLGVETDPLSQPQREQTLSQDMLHRLPKAQVDAERQRRDQVSEPYPHRCRRTKVAPRRGHH